MDLSKFRFKAFEQSMNTHPAFVHFPIALIPVFTLFYFIAWVFQSPAMALAGQWTLGLAWLSTVIAGLTGLRAKHSIPHNAAIHDILTTHERTGYVILTAVTLLAVWSFTNPGGLPPFSGLFVLASAIVTLATLIQGDMGSRMVFLHGAGVKPMQQQLEEEERISQKRPA